MARELAERLSQGATFRDLVVESDLDFRVRTTAYTDPQVFEAEMRTIFETGWVYVAHESEVRNPGDYKTARVGRQPVVISRTDDGQLHVLLNACRHRGAAVCREERGNSRFFRCPYHGWVYDNSGKLIGISERRGFPDDFATDLDGLAPVPRVGAYRGLIFASLSEAGESLDEHLGSVKEEIDLWADLAPSGEVRVLEPHRYAYEGNWKFQVENTVDGYHPRFVHESAFKTVEHFGGPAARYSASARDDGYTLGYDQGHGVLASPPPLGLTRVGLTRLPAELYEPYMATLRRLYGDERTEQIVHNRHVLVFPNLFLMDMNIRVVQPISVDKTEVFSYFVELQDVHHGVNQHRLADLQWRLGTSGLISVDDAEMFAACQTGLHATGIESVRLARGMHLERVRSDGVRIGPYTSETPQRAVYRGWLRLMEAHHPPT